MKIIKAINRFVKLAEIPNYPKCKKCGNADPYLNDDLCYKCFDPGSTSKKMKIHKQNQISQKSKVMMN